MSNNPRAPEIPNHDVFREWLKVALAATDQRPATVSLAIDAGVNSVGAFLRDKSRDITLSRAAMIERHLRKIARDQGRALPAIQCQFEGGGS